MEMAMKILAVLCGLFLFAGCSTHYITKDMLSLQVGGHETLETQFTGMIPVLPLIKATYEGSKITEIYCMNDKGEKVVINVDRNSMLIVKDKQGETFKFYLDTVYFDGSKIKGLRSRLLGMTNEVKMVDVDQMEVYSEFKREKKVGP
jgi:hypothetical protein